MIGSFAALSEVYIDWEFVSVRALFKCMAFTSTVAAGVFFLRAKFSGVSKILAFVAPRYVDSVSQSIGLQTTLDTSGRQRSLLDNQGRTQYSMVFALLSRGSPGPQLELSY